VLPRTARHPSRFARALATSEPRCYFRRIKVSRMRGTERLAERGRTCDVRGTRKRLLEKKENGWEREREI